MRCPLSQRAEDILNTIPYGAAHGHVRLGAAEVVAARQLPHNSANPSAAADDRRHRHDQSTGGDSKADQIFLDVRAYASFRRTQLGSKHGASADGAGTN